MQTEKEYTVGREINSLRCESTGEYSLPDYNGDVKKVLLVKTRVFPSGKFVGDDLLEFSGTVGYNVVYLDADNNITHTEFSTDYEAAVKINSATYRDSDVKTSVINCNARLVGPRKFSVKCSLESDVRISESRVHSIGGDAFMEYEPEILFGAVNVFSSFFAEGEQRDVSEEITSLDGSIVDEVEILLCDASAETVAVDITEGGVSLKGNVTVSMLYKDGDTEPKAVEKIIPYSADVTGAVPDYCECREGRVDITSLKASVNPSDNGVTLNAELSVIPHVYMKKNSKIDVVADAYVKERGIDNEYGEFGYTEYICSEKSEIDFLGEYALTETDAALTEPLTRCDATARVETCEIFDSGAKISGEIRFSAIACQVSDENVTTYVPIKFALPFEQNVNINCQIHDNMRANAHVDVCDVNINISENTIRVNCTLASSVTVFSEKRSRCLAASYLTDKEFVHDESVVTVYYPDACESLFDIAKKFHTSAKRIAEVNRLTEAVFSSQDSPIGGSGVKKILIK